MGKSDMSDYLLIDSRDPFDSSCRYFHDLACELAGKGHDVILFLVQNAVFYDPPLSGNG